MHKGAANVDSLNFVVTYGERRFLFTGDYAHSGAFLKLHTKDVRDVDVLKFPHHGLEPFAIGERALRLVNPSIILVPGSASKVVGLIRENNLHATVYGSTSHIVLLSDGVSLEVVTDVQPGDFRE